MINEIGVFCGHLLQLLGDVQQRIVPRHLPQNLVAHLFHDLAPGIIGLVNAVTKPHEPERVCPIFGPSQERFQFSPAFMDLAEHFHDGLIGAPMERTPQSTYTG